MVTTTLSQTSRGVEKLPLVCAYVITYDGKQFLERCFRTLQERTDYEAREFSRGESSARLSERRLWSRCK